MLSVDLFNLPFMHIFIYWMDNNYFIKSKQFVYSLLNMYYDTK